MTPDLIRGTHHHYPGILEEIYAEIKGTHFPSTPHLGSEADPISPLLLASGPRPAQDSSYSISVSQDLPPPTTTLTILPLDPPPRLPSSPNPSETSRTESILAPPPSPTSELSKTESLRGGRRGKNKEEEDPPGVRRELGKDENQAPLNPRRVQGENEVTQQPAARVGAPVLLKTPNQRVAKSKVNQYVGAEGTFYCMSSKPLLWFWRRHLLRPK